MLIFAKLLRLNMPDCKQCLYDEAKRKTTRINQRQNTGSHRKYYLQGLQLRDLQNKSKSGLRRASDLLLHRFISGEVDVPVLIQYND